MRDPGTHPFTSQSDLVQLIEAFEACTLPREQWNHRAHLAVAMWYLIHFDPLESCRQMIFGIHRYNCVHGIFSTPTGGYHDTMTRFWLQIGHRFLRRQTATTTPLAKVNAFVAEYGGRKDLVFEYYSRQRICSWWARHTWVEPDLKPLDD